MKAWPLRLARICGRSVTMESRDDAVPRVRRASERRLRPDVLRVRRVDRPAISRRALEHFYRMERERMLIPWCWLAEQKRGAAG